MFNVTVPTPTLSNLLVATSTVLTDLPIEYMKKVDFTFGISILFVLLLTGSLIAVTYYKIEVV